MGIIIVIVGLVLIAYSVRITTAPSEIETTWDKAILVSTAEVENMKKQGWVEGIGAGVDDPRFSSWFSPLGTPLDTYNRMQRLKNEYGLVPMTRRLNTVTIEHYVDVYPYQIVGAIVLLIGFVTTVIGVYMPSVRRDM